MYAGAIVGNTHTHFGGRTSGADRHAPTVRRHELERVREQIDHYLHQAVTIGHYREAGRAGVEFQHHPLLDEQCSQRIGRLADDFRDIDGRHRPFGATRLELGQVEDLVDQPRQAHRLADDNAQKTRALREIGLGILLQHLRKCPDRGQRCAQFVGHGGDEVVLHAIQFLQAGIGLAQFRRGSRQFQRLLFEFTRVGAHLGGLVEDVHHLIDAQRLFGHHRGHHRARRGGADGTGQQGFREIDQACIGGKFLDRVQTALPRMTQECFLGTLAAEETTGQGQQVVQPGAASPTGYACRLGAADEQRRLARLAHIRRALQ